MPLTINLLHEEQFLLKQRQRDPLKLGFYALGAVAALFVLFYLYRYASSSHLRSEMHQLEAEWGKLEKQSAAATARETEGSGKQAAAKAVSQRIEFRFYWAPVIDLVLKTVPPNVQIVNFTGNNDPKSDKIDLLFEGLVAGEVPRIAADRFRDSLQIRLAKQFPGATASFRGLDDNASSVTVDGRPQPTARYTIEVIFPKPNAAPPEAPAPEPRRKRS